jgi:hypothetical protein
MSKPSTAASRLLYLAAASVIGVSAFIAKPPRLRRGVLMTSGGSSP